MYTQFASIGAKIIGEMIHPIFRIDNEYHCSKIILVVSKEDNSDPMTIDTHENITDIQTVYEKRGIPTRVMFLTLEDFWDNVGTLAVEILKLAPEIPVGSHS